MNPPLTAPATIPPTGERPAPGGATVLCIEDDPVNVMLMQGIVELRPGCRLRVARDGVQALAAVASAAPGAFDLVLCDLHLPDVPGDELLARLRAAGLPATVPALLVTAEPEAVAAALARTGGFDGHWTKPLDVAATLRSLAHWLGDAGGR